MTCTEERESNDETFHITMLLVNLLFIKRRGTKLEVHPSFGFSVMSDAEHTIFCTYPLSFTGLEGNSDRCELATIYTVGDTDDAVCLRIYAQWGA